MNILEFNSFLYGSNYPIIKWEDKDKIDFWVEQQEEMCSCPECGWESKIKFNKQKMNTQGIINPEALLPSSLLDEVHNEDNENESSLSINFNEKLQLFNEEKKDESPNEVIH